MKFVYVLQHSHVLEQDFEDIKNCGVFSTRERAEQAFNELRKKPGFRDFPELCNGENDLEEGFFIGRCEIDRIEWSDGYATVHY